MKLLIVVANFIPEIGSAAHIYFDLARAFVKRGHEVDVITSYPRKYNLTKNDIFRDFPLEDSIDNIYIHRCKHFFKLDNIFLRGAEHFLLPLYYFRVYRRLKKNFDICLIYIPPLYLYYFAKIIKKYDGVFSVLNFQDFHPQELTDVGVLKNNLIIKLMKATEKSAYKNADFITVLSEGGVDYIIERGGNPSKIANVYNGCDLSNLRLRYLKSDFKKNEKIENKILVSYAGILSPFQGIDTILTVAKQLENHKDIIFYLVGDGMIKDQLDLIIQKRHNSNVKLLPLQPREEYFNIINSSDISIISLDERMKAPCLPGKLINLMSMGKLFIAAVPEDSETARFIIKYNVGLVVNPNDTKQLKEILLNVVSNYSNLEYLGENGRKFAENYMEINKLVSQYEQIFNIILS